MSTDTIRPSVAALKGDALKAKAVELEIKGRTTMKADELRKAIQTELDAREAVSYDDATEELIHELSDDDLTHYVPRCEVPAAGTDSWKAVSPAPMFHQDKRANYERQNGTTKLTPRQARRVRKSINKLPF